MPKIMKISDREIEYACTCGRTIRLEMPPGIEMQKQLIKCFECIKKEETSIELAIKMLDND